MNTGGGIKKRWRNAFFLSICLKKYVMFFFFFNCVVLFEGCFSFPVCHGVSKERNQDVAISLTYSIINHGNY